MICPGPIRLCPAQNDQNGVRAHVVKFGSLLVWVFCRRPRFSCLIIYARATPSAHFTISAFAFPSTLFSRSLAARRKWHPGIEGDSSRHQRDRMPNALQGSSSRSQAREARRIIYLNGWPLVQTWMTRTTPCEFVDIIILYDNMMLEAFRLL